MNTRIEPIELTDDELKAVAGGQASLIINTVNSANSDNDFGAVVASANGAISNSFNGSGNNNSENVS